MRDSENSFIYCEYDLASSPYKANTTFLARNKAAEIIQTSFRNFSQRRQLNSNTDYLNYHSVPVRNINHSI